MVESTNEIEITNITDLALIVSNENYRHFNTVSHSISDGKSVQQELSEMGYEVIECYDKTLEETTQIVDNFCDEIKQSVQRGDYLVRNILIFYSGLVRWSSQVNYLIFVDNEPNQDLTNYGIDVNEFVLKLRISSPNSNFIFIFDTASVNPQISNWSSNSVNLSRMKHNADGYEGGIGIFYSAIPGTLPQRLIEDNQKQSYFVHSLLTHMRSGENIEEIMSRVAYDTFRATTKQQRVWRQVDFVHQVYLDRDGTSGVDILHLSKSSVPYQNTFSSLRNLISHVNNCCRYESKVLVKVHPGSYALSKHLTITHPYVTIEPMFTDKPDNERIGASDEAPLFLFNSSSLMISKNTSFKLTGIRFQTVSHSESFTIALISDSEQSLSIRGCSFVGVQIWLKGDTTSSKQLVEQCDMRGMIGGKNLQPLICTERGGVNRLFNRNQIHDSDYGGVDIKSNDRSTFSSNSIFNFTGQMLALYVRKEANPLLSSNRFFDNTSSIYIDDAFGRYVENRFERDSITSVNVLNSSKPTLFNNYFSHCGWSAIWIKKAGSGMYQNNYIVNIQDSKYPPIYVQNEDCSPIFQDNVLENNAWGNDICYYEENVKLEF